MADTVGNGYVVMGIIDGNYVVVEYPLLSYYAGGVRKLNWRIMSKHELMAWLNAGNKLDNFVLTSNGVLRCTYDKAERYVIKNMPSVGTVSYYVLAKSLRGYYVIELETAHDGTQGTFFAMVWTVTGKENVNAFKNEVLNADIVVNANGAWAFKGRGHELHEINADMVRSLEERVAKAKERAGKSGKRQPENWEAHFIPSSIDYATSKQLDEMGEQVKKNLAERKAQGKGKRQPENWEAHYIPSSLDYATTQQLAGMSERVKKNLANRDKQGKRQPEEWEAHFIQPSIDAATARQLDEIGEQVKKNIAKRKAEGKGKPQPEEWEAHFIPSGIDTDTERQVQEMRARVKENYAKRKAQGKGKPQPENYDGHFVSFTD